MLPLAALIILAAVGVFSSCTFAFAIYWTVKVKVEAKKVKDSEADNDLSLPLTETAAAPGINSRSPTPLPPAPPLPRPPTPEADSPPLLPDTQSVVEHTGAAEPFRITTPPPFLLPATTYGPETPASSTIPSRIPTPEAEFPPPLPDNFPGRVASPVPPHSPMLPPAPSLPPPSLYRKRSASRDGARQNRDRSRGRSPRHYTGPPPPHHRPGVWAKRNPDSSRDPGSRSRSRYNYDTSDRDQETPERPDSMHEIYDIYSNLPPPTPKVVPKSAPAMVTTFAQAQSKWAYFGEKRAESKEGREERTVHTVREMGAQIEIKVAMGENMV